MNSLTTCVAQETMFSEDGTETKQAKEEDVADEEAAEKKN